MTVHGGGGPELVADDNLDFKGAADSLIAALYRREHGQAAARRDELIVRLKTGRQNNQLQHLPLVADALGRMFARHCQGKHIAEGDCGFERLTQWLDPLPMLSEMTVLQGAHMAMFYGLREYHKGQYAEASSRFALARAYGDDLKDSDIAPMSRLYQGRCARKLGEWEQAIAHYSDAQDVLRDCRTDHRPLHTVIEVLKIAEKFHEGHFDDLHKQLDDLTPTLEELGDYSTLGHVERLRGRMLMREGLYQQAVNHLTKSVNSYAERDLNHRGIARSRTNLARATMLYAIHEAPQFDKYSIFQQAEIHLSGAEDNYNHSHEPRHQPEIYTLRAELEFERGNLDKAIDLAKAAYQGASWRLVQHPTRRALHTDLSTAKIIECKCYLRKAEQIRTSDRTADEFIETVNRAQSAAEDAARQAEKTDHPRRQARAAIWKARAMLASPGYRVGHAREAMGLAERTLPDSDRGYIRSEFEELKKYYKTKIDHLRIVGDEPIFLVKASDLLQVRTGGLKMIEDEIIKRAVIYFTERDFGKDAIATMLNIGEKRVALIQERHRKTLLQGRESQYSR